MFLPSTITLKPGDSGDFVAELQRRLSGVNMFEESAISGIYDGITTSAVRNFQSAHGLQNDGIAGPETIRRLNGAFTGNNSSSGSTNSEEEAKEADRATLKDSILTTMASAPVLDPTLMESAREETVKQDAAAEKPLASQQDAALMKDAQAQAAETAQQKIDQQSQMTEMLMNAARERQAQQPPPQKDAMPPKEVVESDRITQKEALANQQEAAKEAIANKPDLAVQKEQLAQQKEQETQAKEMAEKPTRNPLLQKLMDYVEAHLPKDAVREVIQVGSKMLRSGVQQASMPDDGSAPAPEAIQGRAQEQAAQRG